MLWVSIPNVCRVSVYLQIGTENCFKYCFKCTSLRCVCTSVRVCACVWMKDNTVPSCWWDSENSSRLQRRNPIITPRRPCVLLVENRWVHEWTGWKSSRSGLMQKGGRSVSAGMGRAHSDEMLPQDTVWGGLNDVEGEWAEWINTEKFLLHTHTQRSGARPLGSSDTWWSTENLEMLQRDEVLFYTYTGIFINVVFLSGLAFHPHANR